MPDTDPRFFADGSGVWRENGCGARSGIAWEDVYRVIGYKCDQFTEVLTCIELDWSFGEYTQLYSVWPGFREVVGAITATLPGVAPDWYEQVERLAASDPPLEVWRRE